MQHLTDSTLSLIDRTTSKLGPFSSLLDKIVERVVPSVTASACAGSFCKTVCGPRCAHGFAATSYYSTAPRGCEQGIYTCSVHGCFC
jgi:hypothetical protein